MAPGMCEGGRMWRTLWFGHKQKQLLAVLWIYLTISVLAEAPESHRLPSKTFLLPSSCKWPLFFTLVFYFAVLCQSRDNIINTPTLLLWIMTWSINTQNQSNVTHWLWRKAWQCPCPTNLYSRILTFSSSPLLTFMLHHFTFILHYLLSCHITYFPLLAFTLHYLTSNSITCPHTPLLYLHTPLFTFILHCLPVHSIIYSHIPLHTSLSCWTAAVGGGWSLSVLGAGLPALRRALRLDFRRGIWPLWCTWKATSHPNELANRSIIAVQQTIPKTYYSHFAIEECSTQLWQ